MKPSRPYKRKILNLRVNRGMQFHMIARITGILFVSLLISSALYYAYADRQITSSYLLFHIKARNFLDFLFPMVVGSFVISLVVGTVASLFFPKNIAGGLYRMQKELKEVIAGNLTIRIILRRGDKVTALASQLNQLIETFDNRFANQQRALQQAQHLCAESEEDPGVRLAQVHKILSKAMEDLKGLRTSQN